MRVYFQTRMLFKVHDISDVCGGYKARRYGVRIPYWMDHAATWEMHIGTTLEGNLAPLHAYALSLELSFT